MFFEPFVASNVSNVIGFSKISYVFLKNIVFFRNMQSLHLFKKITDLNTVPKYKKKPCYKKAIKKNSSAPNKNYVI